MIKLNLKKMTTIRHMPKSFSTGSLFATSPMSQSEAFFSKTNSILIPNTEGKSPIIIYKKRKKIPNIFDLNLRELGYITDGGLKKKLQRFDGAKTFSKQGISIICTPKQNANFSNTTQLSRSKMCQSMKDIKPKKISEMKTPSRLTPKSQKMNCFERKSLSIGSSKISSPTHRRCLSPEIKYEKMEELVKRAIASKIREYTTEKAKKTRQEEINDKKQKYLEENGIEIQIESLQNEDDDKLEDRKEEYSDNQNDLFKKLSKSNQFNTNSQLQSTVNKERFSRSGSYKDFYHEGMKERKILKPKVDNLEYINKINNEAKRMSNRIRSSSTRSLNSHNNSFRKSSSSQQYSNVLQADQKKKNPFDKENNSLFSNQVNHRSEEELAHFTLSKRIQQQKIEEKEAIESNKKLFMIFKNLYTLSQRLQFKPNKHKKITKKKKVINDFYMGKPTTEYNNSTVIDPDDYYCSVIEGQKLIVKSDFDFQKEKKKKNQNLINRNKIKKEQIQKINKELSQNTTNTNINQSTAQFSELQQRAMKTILRTNNLLSKENINQVLELEKSKNNLNEKQPANEEEEVDNKKKEDDIEEDKHYEDNNLNDDIDDKNKSKNEKPNKQLGILIDNYTTSNNGTKEKNLPSLSHTYTINNTNTNNKQMIEPRAVLNLVEIIKILMQRKVFYMFYEDYFNEAMIQRYTIAFVYFNALLKQRTFHRLACYSNYMLEYYAINQLFKPFIKQSFRSFITKCNSIEKIKYLCELLVHIFKKKSIERIYLYGHVARSVYNIFTKTITRPKLQEAFQYLIEKIQNLNEKTYKIDQSNSSSEMMHDERLQTVSSDHSIESNEKKYVKYKMNTYVYESLSMESEYSVEPNSVDSDRLHRLHMMVLQRNNMTNEGYGLDNQSDEYSSKLTHSQIKRSRPNSQNTSLLNSNSSKKMKSLKDICQMKPGINLSRSNESLEETIKKTLSNKDLRKSLSTKSINSKKRNSNKSSSQNSKDENLSKEDSELNTSKNIQNRREQEESKIKFNQLYKEEETKNKDCLSQLISGDSSENRNIKQKKDDSSISSIREQKDNNNPKSGLNIEEGIVKNPYIPNIKHKEILSAVSEPDISAENDLLGNIDWELALSGSKVNFIENKEDNTKNILKKAIDRSKGIIDSKGDEAYLKLNADITQEKSAIDDKQKSGDFNKENRNFGERCLIDELSPIRANDNELTDGQMITPSSTKKIDNYSQFTPANRIEVKKESSPVNKRHTCSSDNNSYINEFDKANISGIDDSEDNIVSLIQNQANSIEIRDITETIISQLIESEIKDSKLLPHKTLKLDIIQVQPSNSNSFNTSGHALSQHSFTHLTESSYNSLIMNYTALSYFSKTVKDKKKEQSLNLYITKIYPKLIKQIKSEISKNYKKIYKNLNTPIRSIPQGLMTSLALEDAEMLRDNYKSLPLTDEEFQMLNKEKMLKDFEVINKKIRSKDNVTSDNHYDKLLNECIIDTTMELLNQERLYGESGEPLPWSSRIREVQFKYPKDDPTKLSNHIEKELFTLMNYKIGSITENYDYMDVDQLNVEREKKLLNNILNEMNESEHQWINLEMEETQIKIELNELIMEQLYHEVIEIIEHVQYSRRHPELYQNKSIYSCEEIPKLTCQITSDDEREEDNEFMNI